MATGQPIEIGKVRSGPPPLAHTIRKSNLRRVIEAASKLIPGQSLPVHCKTVGQAKSLHRGLKRQGYESDVRHETLWVQAHVHRYRFAEHGDSDMTFGLCLCGATQEAPADITVARRMRA